MPETGPPTILFEIFWANQKRAQLIEAALEGTGLPPEDYPFYVLIGAEGPWTPTDLASGASPATGWISTVGVGVTRAPTGAAAATNPRRAISPATTSGRAKAFI